HVGLEVDYLLPGGVLLGERGDGVELLGDLGQDLVLFAVAHPDDPVPGAHLDERLGDVVVHRDDALWGSVERRLAVAVADGHRLVERLGGDVGVLCFAARAAGNGEPGDHEGGERGGGSGVAAEHDRSSDLLVSANRRDLGASGRRGATSPRRTPDRRPRRRWESRTSEQAIGLVVTGGGDNTPLRVSAGFSPVFPCRGGQLYVRASMP